MGDENSSCQLKHLLHTCLAILRVDVRCYITSCGFVGFVVITVVPEAGLAPVFLSQDPVTGFAPLFGAGPPQAESCLRHSSPLILVSKYTVLFTTSHRAPQSPSPKQKHLQ